MPQQEAVDAITLLKNDHREVEELFKKYENTGSGSKQKLAEQICNELKIHSMIEEEVFYPACEGVVEDADIKEAYVEHDGAKILINDILGEARRDDEYYDAKIKVLQEQIEHHVKEEERGGDSIFGQVKSAKKLDLDQLGEQMAARKAELKAELEAGGSLPPAATATMTALPT